MKKKIIVDSVIAVTLIVATAVIIPVVSEKTEGYHIVTVENNEIWREFVI